MDRENPWFGIIPRISYADKETYVESETKQYDMVISNMPSVTLIVCHYCFSLQAVAAETVNMQLNIHCTLFQMIKLRFG